MNETNRKMVERYLSTVRTDPIHFHEYISDKNEFDPNKYTVEDMIKRVLTLSEMYYSVEDDNEFECGSEKWRSSVDIWRHIIYYYPQVTIFDVMKGLYNIQNECGGQYCGDVRRRVFKYKLGSENNKRSSSWWENHNIGSMSIHMTDEFGLYFSQWEDI